MACAVATIVCAAVSVCSVAWPRRLGQLCVACARAWACSASGGARSPCPSLSLTQLELLLAPLPSTAAGMLQYLYSARMGGHCRGRCSASLSLWRPTTLAAGGTRSAGFRYAPQTEESDGQGKNCLARGGKKEPPLAPASLPSPCPSLSCTP